jgi:hypothetical protein
MGGTCSTCVEMKNVYRSLVKKPKEMGNNIKIALKVVMGVRTGFYWLRIEAVADSLSTW